MITILIGLFWGWVLGLIGLDTLLRNTIGFDTQDYYLLWFLMGCAIWLVRLIKK